MIQNTIKICHNAYTWWINSLCIFLVSSGNRKQYWDIFAVFRGGRIEFYQGRSGGSEPVATLEHNAPDAEAARLRKKILNLQRSGNEKISLRLSADDVLQKQLKLPLQARDFIEPVIRNQIRRIVPWPEGETCFSYEITGETRNADTLEVNVVAASRVFIDDNLKKLQSLGFSPASVEYRDDDNHESGLALLQPGKSPAERMASGVNRMVLSFISLGLLVTGFGAIQLYSLRAENTGLELSIDKISQEFRELDRKNNADRKLGEHGRYLVKLKKEAPPAVLLVEALSRALPDNAWLDRLEIGKKEIILSGQARNTTDLVKTLEDADVLEKVRFSAPTVRTGIADVESFSILANTHPAEQIGEAK